MNNLNKSFCLRKKDFFFRKEIRSFVFRRTKISSFKKYIITKYWKKFCVNFNYKKKKNFFYKKFPIIVDIGFGDGKKLIYDVQKNVGINFLGIEVYLNGIINCINKCNYYNITNFKMIYFDAFKVFKYMLEDNSIFKVQIFFPDPWRKKKHNKRRLINLMFLSLIMLKLKKNGILHIMTDCKIYCKNIIKNIKFINFFKEFFFIDNKYKFSDCNLNIFTKYESKAKNKNNFIYNIIYKKI